MSLRITIDDIRKAEGVIAGQVLRTPCVASPGLAAVLGRPVALKLETLQLAGCFKPRGIVNKVLSLSAEERDKGIVTVSGGNHGIATAMMARTMGLAATIVMPQAAPERSKARIRADGANLILTPDVAAAFDVAEAERAKGLTYVHSYDDPLIMAGHGTLGLEFIADAPGLTDVLVSIGGGALISGVATAIKAVKPDVRIWGVETQGADAMAQALAAQRPVQIKVTSISSTLGAPYVTERTLEHVKALVEEVIVVSDADAVAGAVTLAEEARLWVEPAAGCLIPAAREVVKRAGADAMIGLVLCGGNTSVADMTRWVDRFSVGDAATAR
ncbi:threonine/serine dehydratase [Reyranella sp. CPCC 100927]|uniref:threonine ammonia-lyase n=1 Tax=Reyranella sp. CPCC 100927 TaxID=2599616 RepID=UPI0011B3D37D|nr:pyridoxal-phosphate dependent enzyme [Reyranella sp. CPCC 100927]TWT10836.1 pyridoxal-phosphate dependent enzyme [Reyranella sp. CPCC 100927]